MTNTNLNLYEILGIDNKATLKEIKLAYLKLSSKYHPDKNKDVGTSEDFKSINCAYEVLKDTVKRERYDLTGDIGDKPEYNPLDDLAILFASTIDKVEFKGDIISNIKEQLKTQSRQCMVDLKSLKSTLAKLNKTLGRINTDSECNLFESILIGKIDVLKNRITAMDAAIARLNNLIDCLNSYTDSSPEIITPRHNRFGLPPNSLGAFASGAFGRAW